MYKIIKKFKQIFILVTMERFPNAFRPSSLPYVTGDTLRNYADHIFDESKTINLKNIKYGDIIFLSSNLLEIFFRYFDPNITQKYILITHNSDRNISVNEIKFKSNNVIHWFAQNLTVLETDNISMIPIGLENLRWLKNGRKKWFKPKNYKKSKYILSSFNEKTNFTKRENINTNFKDISFIEIKNFENNKEYFKEFKNFKFCICPEGNGIDTHRIWESILLKIIPIMISSDFAKNLEYNSIPCLIIKNWEELKNYSREDLDKIYLSQLESRNFDVSLFSFWKTIIKSKQMII